MKMEQTECSEMSAYKIQTPGNYPEESIQDTDGLNLKLNSMQWMSLLCSHSGGSGTNARTENS